MDVKLKSAWEQSLERRRSLFDERGLTMYRLLHGDAEGIPGFFVDRFGEVVILSLQEGRSSLGTKSIESLAELSLDLEGVETAILKRLPARRFDLPVDRSEHGQSQVFGKATQARVKCQENALSYWIYPDQGFGTGVFLDQRENRRWVKEISEGKKVLNAFSYACAFSIASAAGGAASVTSVDLSRRALGQGQDVFELNGIRKDQHRFVPSGFFSFARRASRRAELFDVILLDPPSFSRSHDDGVFSIEKDWRELLKAALSILSPGGVIFFSTNLRGFKMDGVRAWAEDLVSHSLQEQVLPPLPIDFRWPNYALSSIAFRMQESD